MRRFLRAYLFTVLASLVHGQSSYQKPPKFRCNHGGRAHPGNYLAIRNLESCVMNLNALLSNMRKVQDNVDFSSRNSVDGLDNIKDLMKSSFNMKVRFDNTIGEIMGKFQAVPGKLHAVELCIGDRTSCSTARQTMSFDEPLAKLRVVKKMLDTEVNEAIDQFEEILESWSGKEVIGFRKQEIEAIDSQIAAHEKVLEKLAKESFTLESNKAKAIGEAAAATAALKLLKTEDERIQIDRTWEKSMQFAKFCLDAADTAVNIHTGPLKILGLGGGDKVADVQPLTQEQKNTMSSQEIMEHTAKYTQQREEKTKMVNVIAKQCQEKQAQTREEINKKRNLESKRRKFDRDIKAQLAQVNAVNVAHYTVMYDVINDFFYQKKNIMALSTSISFFEDAIVGWHKLWEAYEAKPVSFKRDMMKCVQSHPQQWGMYQPDLWTSAQILPELLQETAADPFKKLKTEKEDPGKLLSYGKMIEAYYMEQDKLSVRWQKENLGNDKGQPAPGFRPGFSGGVELTPTVDGDDLSPHLEF